MRGNSGWILVGFRYGIFVDIRPNTTAQNTEPTTRARLKVAKKMDSLPLESRLFIFRTSDLGRCADRPSPASGRLEARPG